jgi:hypothetical protein
VTDTEALRLLHPCTGHAGSQTVLAVACAIHHAWIRAASVVASCSP